MASTPPGLRSAMPKDRDTVQDWTVSGNLSERGVFPKLSIDMARRVIAPDRWPRDY
jgi:hypothetical protein